MGLRTYLPVRAENKKNRLDAYILQKPERVYTTGRIPLSGTGFMNNNALYLILFVLVLLFVARRFLGSKEPFAEYSRKKHELIMREMEAMRRENSHLSAQEALAPVKSGLEELLELHASPLHVQLETHESSIRLQGAHTSYTISWRLPVTSLHSLRKTVQGTGHWELMHADGQFEHYDDLARFMGRLSAIVRDMAEHPSVERLSGSN